MPKKLTLDTLTEDSKNANQGTGAGRQAVKASLEAYGAGRSVLADKNGVIIAGNKTVEAARELGLSKIRVVEATGDELIVVQRTDLDLETDEKARGLAYADNRAAELGLRWNQAQLAQDLEDGRFAMPAAFQMGDLTAALAGVSSALSAARDSDVQERQIVGSRVPAAEGAYDSPAPGLGLPADAAFLNDYLPGEEEEGSFATEAGADPAEAATGTGAEEHVKVLFLLLPADRDRLFEVLNRIKAANQLATHAEALLSLATAWSEV